ENVGATRNTGVELALSTLLVQDWHGLRWNMDVNAAANRNQIVRLSSGLLRDPGNKWFVGYPISVAYDYQFGGIWQIQDSISGEAQRYGRRPGQIRVIDQNGDGKIDQSDRIILGTTFPRWTTSMTNRVDWKGLDLSVMAVARLGFLVQDSLRNGGQSTLAGRYNNIFVNYWTPTNPSNTEPRPNAAQENPDYGGIRGYGDGSFIKVRSITVGYTLPGSVNLDEDVVTGLTPGSYGTQAVFESLVNASYEPLRSFYAQERGFTVTEFGTDIFTKGADGSFKYINDYTTQLNPTAQYVQDTWVDFYRAINTTNAAIDQAPVVVMESTRKARRVAEARFLRARYYFDLRQMYV